jgi:hypothetical protein
MSQNWPTWLAVSGAINPLPDMEDRHVSTTVPGAARGGLFVTLALAWLALPDLIFLVTWVRPWIGIPAAIIIVISLSRILNISLPGKISRWPLGLALLAALFWMLFGGVGGVLPQCSDYIKHNLLFHDLASQPWPVKYEGGGESYYLCYGLGYYLVPALGGKIFGIAMVSALSFLWAFAGLALFFYWVATIDGTPGKTLPMFLLFAVTGVVWLLVKRLGIHGWISADDLGVKLKQFGLYFSYNDSFTRFQYQPQHALSGWLGAAVLYELLWVKKNPRGAVLAWALCLFWSPMSALGLLVIPLAALRRVRWQDYFEPVNLVGGGVLLFIAGVYFSGHVPLAESGPIWEYSPGSNWPIFYCLFVVLELTPLLFIFLVDRKYHVLGDWRPLFFMATIFLLLLPLWKFGHNSDLRMQASGPALLFGALAANRCFQPRMFALKTPVSIGLAIVLVLGAFYPFTRPWLIFQFKPREFSYENVVKEHGYHNLYEMRDIEFNSSTQYLGRTNSAAACWLLR